ncbi:DMT family transporter, partial [Phytoactinopolyspora endophytica]|uniref:DMT family transporter n=1 Tax=Phytoactinopolyspora endophytica TaxID=1642495 RepID=UPI00101C9D12
MNAWGIAVGLSIAAALFHAVAAVFQERMAGDRRAKVAHRLGTLRMLSRPRWWWAVVLTGVASGLHVAALHFGPLTVVQPLGALTLVLALSLSAALAGRKVGRTEWLGLSLTMAGLALLLLLTPVDNEREALSPNEVLGVSLVAVGAMATLVLGAARSRRLVPRSLLHAGAAGVAFGVASALAQTVTVRMSRSGWEEAITPAAAMVIVLAFGGLLLAQAAYRAGIGAPLATLTIVNPIVAAIIGLRLLGEHFEAGAGGAVLAGVAGIAAAGGVVLLAR